MTHQIDNTARDIAIEALREIADYPTCLTPALIAMHTLDKLGIEHRGTTPKPLPNPIVHPGAKTRVPEVKHIGKER